MSVNNETGTAVIVLKFAYLNKSHVSICNYIANPSPKKTVTAPPRRESVRSVLPEEQIMVKSKSVDFIAPIMERKHT